MTYEIYRYVFLGAAAASLIMLAVSIALFFVFKIPKVIGDLTGRTARKAIEDIRRQNEESGDKTYKSSAVNLQRGKLTDKITKSGRLQKREDSPFGTGVITEQLSGNHAAMPTNETTVLTANETTVLYESNETTVLSANETTVLSAESMETTVLSQDTYVSAPAVAPVAQPVVPQPVQTAQPRFQVEYEITYIHTREIIG